MLVEKIVQHLAAAALEETFGMREITLHHLALPQRDAWAQVARAVSGRAGVDLCAVGCDVCQRQFCLFLLETTHSCLKVNWQARRRNGHMTHLGREHLCVVEAASCASYLVYCFTSGQHGNLRLDLLPTLVF
jgi:hypothetical protein